MEEKEVRFILRDIEARLSASQIKSAFLNNIPPWVKDSRAAAPSGMIDALREGIKAVIRPFMGKLLTWAYGEAAPKLGRRDDILPVLMELVADLLLFYAVQFSPFTLNSEVETNEDGNSIHKILSVVANAPNRDNEDATTESRI